MVTQPVKNNNNNFVLYPAALLKCMYLSAVSVMAPKNRKINSMHENCNTNFSLFLKILRPMIYNSEITAKNNKKVLSTVIVSVK